MLHALVAHILNALPPVDPAVTNDIGAFLGLVMDAVKDKNYGYLLALAIIAFVALLKKYDEKIPKVGLAIDKFLKSDLGGVLAVFVTSFGIALAAATAGGDKLSGAIALGALKAAFLAMGGYATIKKAIWPVLEWLLKKLGVIKDGAAAADAVATDANKLASDGKASDDAAADALNKALDKK